MNILSSFDLIFDVFGLLISILNPWLFLVTIPMYFADMFAIWIVSLEKPFIFFESQLLETIILSTIMAQDIAYDLMWLILWAIVYIDDDDS